MKTSTQVRIGATDYAAEALTLPPTGRAFRDAWEVTAGGVVVVDWARARAQFRQTATMPKPSFVMAAVELGFLSEADAVSAAKGDWPASFGDVLAALPAAERLGAQVQWASVAEVRRDAPLVALIGQVKGITDEQFDAMFGYAGE